MQNLETRARATPNSLPNSNPVLRTMCLITLMQPRNLGTNVTKPGILNNSQSLPDLWTRLRTSIPAKSCKVCWSFLCSRTLSTPPQEFSNHRAPQHHQPSQATEHERRGHSAAPPKHQQTQQQDPEHDHEQEDPKWEPDSKSTRAVPKGQLPIQQSSRTRRIPKQYQQFIQKTFRGRLARPGSKAMTTLFPTHCAEAGSDWHQ